MSRRLIDLEFYKTKRWRQVPARYKAAWAQVYASANIGGIFELDFEELSRWVGEEIDEATFWKVFENKIFRIRNEARGEMVGFIPDVVVTQIGNLAPDPVTGTHSPAKRATLKILQPLGLVDEKYQIITPCIENEIILTKSEPVLQVVECPAEEKAADKFSDSVPIHSYTHTIQIPKGGAGGEPENPAPEPPAKLYVPDVPASERKGPIPEFAVEPVAETLLAKVSHQLQQKWLDENGSVEGILEELRDAANWLEENGKKKKNFGLFFSRWLKQLYSKNPKILEHRDRVDRNRKFIDLKTKLEELKSTPPEPLPKPIFELPGGA